MTPCVLGVDSSTTSTTVELRRLADGQVTARASAAHPPTSPPISEQRPEAWWAALVEALGQLAGRLDGVVAMSVAAQQHGLVLLDGSGRPLRAAPLWNDTTAAGAARHLRELRSERWWAQAVGSVPGAAFTVAKLAHLHATEPDVVARTRRVALPHDWLTWRLTGRHVTDRGDASGSGWWSPATGETCVEALEVATGDGAAWATRLPEVLGPSAAAGVVPDLVARELGLPPGVVVGPGTGDNMAAALALRLDPGDVVVSLGTSGTVYAVSEGPSADPTGAVAGFADATGRFLPLVCTSNATKVTDAVARWLGVDHDDLAALALEAGEATGPVLVPHLDGERTPELPDATGTWTGLRTSTTRADLARSAHVGVLCGLLDGVDALAAAGVRVDGRRLVVGGGARSPAYRQLLADLVAQEVVVPDADEAVAAGAGLQAAAVATGRPFHEIAETWGLGTATTVTPRAAARPAVVRTAYAEALAASRPPGDSPG